MASNTWKTMNGQPRHKITKLTKGDVPLAPGVYAFYRGGEACYVGKAGNLQNRVWKAHCGNGQSMRNSAFRRNVAEHLGVATANAIYTKVHPPNPEEARRVRAWIEGCEVAWMTQPTEPEAVALETALKAEWTPKLTKR